MNVEKNSTYIKGTLKVHFVERIVDDVKCELKFYMTSISEKEIRMMDYKLPELLPRVGLYYLVEYEGALWPGQVMEVWQNEKRVKVRWMVKAMAPKGSTWVWPITTDEHDYPICDLKKRIDTPKLLPGGNRGIIFSVAELSHIWR